MCVTVGGYAIGGVSGRSLNPAVSVGIDTVHAIVNHGKFVNCLAYSGVEVIGAMIAAGLFYIVRLNTEYDNKKQKN
jgi:glycerol uptake facilitator-like aquaporin